MGGLFNPEGGFMRYGAKLWDMMWLNVLTVICSLPIITAGPALTAMHYVLYKIYRDEESGITKLFFKSFGQNLKQGLVIQLLFLLVAYLLGTSLRMFWAQDTTKIIFWVVVVVSVAVVCIWMWSLILLSRYTNSVVNLFKTALAISVVHPFRTLFMAVIFVIPGFVLLFTDKALIFVAVLGCTGPGIVQTLWYSGVFKKLETAPENDRDAAQEKDEEAV